MAPHTGPGDGPTIIEPLDFRTRARRARGRRPLGRWLVIVLLVAFVGCLAVAGWFVTPETPPPNPLLL